MASQTPLSPEQKAQAAALDVEQLLKQHRIAASHLIRLCLNPEYTMPPYYRQMLTSMEFLNGAGSASESIQAHITATYHLTGNRIEHVSSPRAEAPVSNLRRFLKNFGL